MSKLYKSFPLIVALCATFLFIAAMSPMSWIGGVFSIRIGVISVVLAVITAYCVTTYLEDF